jgi:hypothetical protein
VRHLDIHEDEELDEALFAAWLKQASEPVARQTHLSCHSADGFAKRDPPILMNQNGGRAA